MLYYTVYNFLFFLQDINMNIIAFSEALEKIIHNRKQCSISDFQVLTSERIDRHNLMWPSRTPIEETFVVTRTGVIAGGFLEILNMPRPWLFEGGNY